MIKRISMQAFKDFYAKHAQMVLIGLLVGLTAILYAPTLKYGFFFDDLPTIIDHEHIGKAEWSAHLFKHTRWVSRTIQQALYRSNEHNPFGYRLFYLMLHIVTGLMLFVFFQRVLVRWRDGSFSQRYGQLISFSAAALFLLHPVQTQTVTYITQMGMEGVAAFFIMLSVLLFQSFVVAQGLAKKVAWCGALFLCALLATGTKEIVLVLPMLLFLVDFVLLRGNDTKTFRWRLLLHLCLAVLVFGMLGKLGIRATQTIRSIPTAAVDNNRGNILTPEPKQKITSIDFLISQPKVILHYLTIFFLPVNLSFDYDIKLSQHWYDADVLIPLGILLTLALLMLFALITLRMQLVFFALTWFFLTVLPRASFVPTQELVCDYKTYISSMGIVLLLAMLLVFMLERASTFIALPRRQTIAGLCAFVCCITLLGAHQRTLVWSSELLFWKDVIAKAPKKSRAYNNYAVCLFEKGDINAALANYQKAIELDGDYGEPHSNIAYCYQMIGNVDKALDHYNRFLDIGEMHPQAYNNMGNLYLSIGDFERAEVAFAMAIQLRPSLVRAAVGIGHVQFLKGQFDAAIETLLPLQAGRDCREERYFWLGSAYFNKMDLQRAKPQLEALRFQKDPRVGFMLGCCYYEEGNFAAAVEQLELAYAHKPDDVPVVYNFALARLKSGDPRSALELFAQCSQHEQHFPFVRFQQAVCLAQLGDESAARQLCEKILQSGPAIDDLRNDCKALMNSLQQDKELKHDA